MILKNLRLRELLSIPNIFQEMYNNGIGIPIYNNREVSIIRKSCKTFKQTLGLKPEEQNGQLFDVRDGTE